MTDGCGENNPDENPRLQVSFDYLSEKALIVRRNAKVNGTHIDLPTRSIPSQRIEDEEIENIATGINELYVKLTPEELDDALNGEESPIEDKIPASAYNGGGNEITVLFVEVRDRNDLSQNEQNYILDEMLKVSDILTPPLFADLAHDARKEHKRLRDGPQLATPNNNRYFRDYKQVQKDFFQLAKKREPQEPLMGVIPRIEGHYIKKLVEMHDDKGVDAICMNFNRATITSGDQPDMVRSLLQWTLNYYSQDDYPLLYALNLYHQREKDGIYPPGDFAALLMGFDILGGCHVLPRGGSNTTQYDFRIFDREKIAWRDVAPENLVSEFPEPSSLDASVVRTKIENRDDFYRLKDVLAAEQMGITAFELRANLDGGSAYEEFSTRDGFAHIKDAVNTARTGFNAGLQQAAIEDFEN